jgi:DNA (cytosine-5)-methyltransferase 1
LKPKLLDLCCKGGGASKGYADAGFDVTGCDIAPQPKYPYKFIQADALTIDLSGYDAFHASPPCQEYSTISKNIHKKDYPDIIAPIRERLIATGKPYVIENVEGAPLINAPLLLCGTMFQIRIRRHRLFENNFGLWFAPSSCDHSRKVARHGRPAKDNELIAVTGHFSGVSEAQRVMGINWLGQEELREAIPPAFTEYIGKYLLGVVLRQMTV